MHVANCEYFLLSISCEMNADQSLFVVDLNERWGDSTDLVRSIWLINPIIMYSSDILLKTINKLK